MQVSDDEEATHVRDAVLTLAGGDAAPTRVYVPRALRQLDALPSRGAETQVSATRAQGLRHGDAGRAPARALVLRVGFALAVGAALVVAVGVEVPQHAPPNRSESTASTVSTPHPAATRQSRIDEARPAVPAASSETPSADRSTLAAARSTLDASASRAEASRLLSVGAYAGALDAYRALSLADAQAPVFAVIVDVLERRIAVRCDGDRGEGGVTCKASPSRLP